MHRLVDESYCLHYCCYSDSTDPQAPPIATVAGLKHASTRDFLALPRLLRKMHKIDTISISIHIQLTQPSPIDSKRFITMEFDFASIYNCACWTRSSDVAVLLGSGLMCEVLFNVTH
jgi:hypothetical protein